MVLSRRVRGLLGIRDRRRSLEKGARRRIRMPALKIRSKIRSKELRLRSRRLGEQGEGVSE